MIRPQIPAAALLAALVLGAAAPAQAQQTPDFKTQIQRADRNGDEAVSKQELFQSRIPPLRRNLTDLAREQIEAYDRNNDGLLSAEEIAETRAERMRKLWSRRFEAIDEDGNGTIDADELEALQARVR